MKIIKQIFRKAFGFRSGTKHQKELLKQWTKNGKYLEIGVWKGDFSSQIQKVCQPIELHLLDPWEFQPKFKNRMFGGSVAKNQAGMDEIYTFVVNRFTSFNNVHYHRGFSSDLHESFDNQYFDAVYIDGNHYFDFVWEDLNNYLSKVKVGGLITGDDYYWSAEELNGVHPVKDAVAKFVEANKGTVEFVGLIGDQFVLKRIK